MSVFLSSERARMPIVPRRTWNMQQSTDRSEHACRLIVLLVRWHQMSVQLGDLMHMLPLAPDLE